MDIDIPNPFLYIIWCKDREEGPPVLWKLYHHGKNAETKCKQLNDDYGPRLLFYVSGLEAGDTS